MVEGNSRGEIWIIASKDNMYWSKEKRSWHADRRYAKIFIRDSESCSYIRDPRTYPGTWDQINYGRTFEETEHCIPFINFPIDDILDKGLNILESQRNGFSFPFICGFTKDLFRPLNLRTSVLSRKCSGQDHPITEANHSSGESSNCSPSWRTRFFRFCFRFFINYLNLHFWNFMYYFLLFLWCWV